MNDERNDPATHGARLRDLFEQACDLPAAQRRAHLETLSNDPALVEEVLALLDAQTESLGRAVAPLAAAMAKLPDTELQVGDALGQWRLAEKLASGGMGTVFIAERADALYRQRVAIKLLRGHADDTGAAQLAAERQILAGLQHPNIARLYDGGTTPAGRPYLVMECVDGVPLDDHLATQRPGLAARLALFDGICAAVSHAHGQLVLHCDLKPGNVLVRADGSPVLLDFGIARLVGDDGDGRVYCTPAYASPELLRGARADVTSDVFSLGVLLAELLSGQRPRRGFGDAATPLPLPSQQADAALPWRAKLRGDLDAIVARAAALDPAQRYPSVAALREDLERARQHYPVQARAATPGYRVGRFLRRRWRETAVAMCALLLSTGFVTRLAIERERAIEAATTAEQVSEFLVAAFAAADPRQNSASQEVSARQILDAGAARIDADLAAQPAVQARLRLVLGQAYRNLGQPQRAQALLQQAADGFLSAAVARPGDAADAYSQLSVILGNDERGEEAVAAARRAVALRAQAGLDDDPAIRADSLNSLGLALQRIDDVAGAEAALKESLALRRGLGEAGRKSSLATLNNLGLMYRHARRFDEAAAMYRESIAIGRALGADARPSYQTSLDGLARVLNKQERRDEALPLLRESLQLARTLYGPDSESVGDAHNELANVLHDAGRLAEAEPHYREAVRLNGLANGTDSPSYAISINNLGSLLEDRGELAGAEALYRQSLAIRRAALPAGDVMILRSQNNLGRLLLRQGELAEADALLAPVLAARRAKVAADHPDRIKTELLEVERLLAHGRIDAAARALDAFPLPADQQAKAPGAWAEALRGDIAQANGNATAARTHRERALAILAALGPAGRPMAARVEAAMARATASPTRTAAR